MPITTLSLIVQEVIQETPDTVTIVFDNPKEVRTYRAGQFLTISFTHQRKQCYRAYSLATTPAVDALPAITVKRVPRGIVSNYINDHVQAGDTLTFLPPKGTFGLPSDQTTLCHLVIVAGGSGIVPLFAILKEALATLPETRVTLLYASRTEADIIYAQELATLAKASKGRLRIIHALSRPHERWPGYRGRLTRNDIKVLLGGLLEGSTQCFICGPPGLMMIAAESLTALGVDPSHIHQESFEAQPFSPPPTTSKQVSAVTFAYEGEHYTCQAAEGKSILESAAEEGIDIPYACGAGTCNTCRVRCVEGAVTMIEDEGLTPEEVAEGYVLACVAYPKTEKVTIEVD